MEELISTLLLNESRQGVRKGVADIMFGLCGFTPSQKRELKVSGAKNATTVNKQPSTSPMTVPMASTLWNSIIVLFPETVEFTKSAQEFFEVALAVFQTMSTLSPEELNYEVLLRQWGETLLSHRTEEVCVYLPMPPTL